MVTPGEKVFTFLRERHDYTRNVITVPVIYFKMVVVDGIDLYGSGALAQREVAVVTVGTETLGGVD